jgi:type I restriction-modification system DNA methylase subunit
MVALKGDKEIGDKINKIIAKLAEANDLQKVIDQADFNDEEKLGKGKEIQDRLSSPQFTKGGQLRTFDFVVMNPPFSEKSWSNGLENDYGRFEFGIPPAKNGDYAFLPHALKSLKSTGKAAVIMPHGVLFRRNAEAAIRKALLQHGYVKGIIGLPPNLFYGTSSMAPPLWHRNPCLHRCARQGERPGPYRRLHDRCFQGLHQGRSQEPAPQPGHPQDRRRLHQADRDRALFADGSSRGSTRAR